MDSNMRNQKLSEIRNSWRQILALLAGILGIVRDLRNESDFGYIYSELMQKIAEAMRLIVEQMCKLSGEPYLSMDKSLNDVHSHEVDPFTAFNTSVEKETPIFVDHSEDRHGDSEQGKHLFME